MVKEKPLAAFGLFIILALIFMAIFAGYGDNSWIAPYHFREPHISDRLVGPGSTYLLGTDELGRDLLSRIIYGSRISLFVALGAVGLGTGAATLFGVSSAYIGGRFDIIFQRITDAWLSIPWLLLMLGVITLLPREPIISGIPNETWGIIKVIIALGIGDMAWASRVIRGSAMTVKENQYVEAARAVGAPPWRVITRYIMPNIAAPIIIMATLGLGFAILSEAALSFLGLGVPPPNPSWGGMMQDRARHHIVTSWWVGVFPGVAITLAVFGINMLGDGLRDLLDPRLRGGGRGGFFGR
ncbi:MAG: ABC transporter permease [Dehalococcoidia bacterium]